MDALGFYLYMLMIVSYFLRLSARFSFLGSIRFDLLLIILIFLLKLLQGNKRALAIKNECERKLHLLIITILVITPFAQYPGSVLRGGIPIFIKGIVFFYFTVWFVTTGKRLFIFVSLFTFCQTFRILEPLYLHLTEGYWGDRASMLGGEEFMNRLAGAPYDTINPNGLAFVILTLIPFIPVFFRINYLWKLVFLIITSLAVYALMLTGSRSGLICLILIIIYAIRKSERKVLYISGAVIFGMFLLANMTDVLKDRYTSIYDSNTKNASTSAGRIEGLIRDFEVGLNRPIFGYGLGTSSEANFNYANSALRSHNIYIEVFQELGLVGFTVFFMYVWEIYKDIFRNRLKIAVERDNTLSIIQESLALLFLVTLVFGFASYGLSGYTWYLIGGLCVSIRCMNNNVPKIYTDLLRTET